MPHTDDNLGVTPTGTTPLMEEVLDIPASESAEVESEETNQPELPKPINKRLTKTKREEIVKDICSAVEKIEAKREGVGGLYELMEKWTKQYFNIVKEKTHPWPNCSNFHAPLTMIDIDSHAERLVNINLGAKPYARALPDKLEEKENAQNGETLLNFQLEEEIHLPKLLWDLAINSMLYPIGIVEVGWEKVIRKVKVKEQQSIPEFTLEPLTNTMIETGSVTHEVEVEREEDVRNGPVANLINLKDFLFSSNATDLEFDDLYLRYWFTLTDLKRKETNGEIENIDKLQKRDEPKKWKYDIEVKGKLEGARHSSEEERPEKEIIKAWKRIDLDGDGIEEDWVFVVSRHDRVMLYGNPNPFEHGKRNIVVCNLHRVPGRILGQSRAARQRQLNNMINSSFNVMMDNSELATHKVLVATEHSGFDPNKQRRYPGAVITISGEIGTDLKELEVSDIKGSMITLNAQLLDYWRQLTQITESVQGRFPAGVERPSARGTGLLLQQTETGLETLNIFFQEALSEIYLQILQLDQQFLPDKKAIRILGEGGDINFLQLNREDIQCRCKVRPQGNSITSNRVQERRDTLLLFDLLKNDPLINQVNLRKNILRTFDIKNAGDLISSSADTIQERAEQMALAQSQPGGQEGLRLPENQPQLQPSELS